MFAKKLQVSGKNLQEIQQASAGARTVQSSLGSGQLYTIRSLGGSQWRRWLSSDLEEAILMMELPRRHATSLSGSRLAPITIVISRG